MYVPGRMMQFLSVLFGAALCFVALFLAILVSPFLAFAQSAQEIGCACAIVAGLSTTLLVGIVLILRARAPATIQRGVYLILGILSASAGIAWGLIMLWDLGNFNRLMLLAPAAIFALGCHWIRLGMQREIEWSD